MSWIKIRTNLATDPSVSAIGIRTKMHPREVVGSLVAVWCWADPLTADGRVEHATPALIDSISGKKGFALAMAGVQWLTIETDAVVFPKWDRHHSQSAKARAGESERKRISRLSEHQVRKMSGQNSGQSAEQSPDQRRVEEIREELIPPTPLQGELVSVEKHVESEKPPMLRRVEKLFGRTERRKLSVSEQRAWRAGQAMVGETTEREWEILEWWFSLSPETAPYRKTDMAACLNNWHAEIAKATRNKMQAQPATPVDHVKPRIPDNLREDYNL